MNEFEKWFEEQYGKRPFAPSITITKMQESVTVAKYNLDVAMHQLETLKEYDVRFDAAYKAWLAR